MGFHLEIPPVPTSGDPRTLVVYLQQQRELLIRLVKHLNDIGCGLEFGTEHHLQVHHDGQTIECDDDFGLYVVALNEGGLGGTTAMDTARLSAAG